MVMTNIIIQFSSLKGSFFSKLIEWFTWGNYAHVDVIMPRGAAIIGARLIGGVQIRTNDMDYSKIKQYSISVPEATADQIYASLRGQVGAGYDWLGILSFPLRLRWNRPNRWFCSELIAWAFYVNGVQLVSEPRFERLTPRDLRLSPVLRPLPG
jgi:hypothetical protein